MVHRVAQQLVSVDWFSMCVDVQNEDRDGDGVEADTVGEQQRLDFVFSVCEKQFY